MEINKMITTAMKTFFAVMIAFLPPGCNGNFLIASWNDSNNANGGGGTSQVIEQGGSNSQGGFGGSGGSLNQGGAGGEINDMDGGSSERSCFCLGLISSGDTDFKCDDPIANQKFIDVKTCLCNMDFSTADEICRNCAIDYCHNNHFKACIGCFINLNDNSCYSKWTSCIQDK